MSKAVSKSRLTRILYHPLSVVLGIIGSVASLISIPLAIYFYVQAREFPELTYYVHPVKAVVMKADQASKLTASFENKLISTDVTAAQVAIWNQGKVSIKKSNVLKPVALYTENNVPILEATIRKSSRDVIQLALGTDELQKGRLTVSWDILEQNDGGIIQIIYAGNPNIYIGVDGIIEGQKQIDKLESPEKIQSPDEQYASLRQSNKVTGFIFLGLGILMLVTAVFFIIKYMREGIFERSDVKFVGPLLITCLLECSVGVYFLLRSQEVGPPFGF